MDEVLSEQQTPMQCMKKMPCCEKENKCYQQKPWIQNTNYFAKSCKKWVKYCKQQQQMPCCEKESKCYQQMPCMQNSSILLNLARN
jgi:hypothetical protein